MFLFLLFILITIHFITLTELAMRWFQSPNRVQWQGPWEQKHFVCYPKTKTCQHAFMVSLQATHTWNPGFGWLQGGEHQHLFLEELDKAHCHSNKCIVLETKLANHHDERFAKWLIQGFSEGFRIGYPRQGTGPLKSAGRNMLSAKSHKELVSSYPKAELQEGQVACCGPVSMTKLLNIYVSPFGVIPKKGRPNWW